jgi:hypothetical protein
VAVALADALLGDGRAAAKGGRPEALLLLFLSSFF